MSSTRWLHFAVLIAVLAGLALAGCGSTYQGKWVSYPVDKTPKDEFKAGSNYVVLAIEYPAEQDAEATLYRFHIFEKGAKVREIVVSARIVSGMRRFYMTEFYNGQSTTHAQFATKPDYETAKNKVGEVLGGLREND